MIRRADLADRQSIVRMGRDFLLASGLNLTFDAAWADASARSAILDVDQLVLVLEIDGCVCGMLCAACGFSPLAPVRVARETVFWIDPHIRGLWAGAFISAYEEWAKSRGCAVVGLASLEIKRVGPLYQRRGYVPVEQHFLKVF